MNKCVTTVISLILVFSFASAQAKQNPSSPNEAKYCGYVDLDGNLNKPDNIIRFATFNASLNRSNPGQLIDDLSTPGNAQAEAVAEIIQRVNPDVLLINEFDFDEAGEALELFRANYIEISQNGQQPVEFPYAFLAPSNTGVFSGFDLDNSGSADPKSGNDAFGFGDFEGQYGMVLLSKFPIDEHAARTFQYFLWNDMPGASLPINPNTNEPWYSEDELNVLRLSSKSHWDVPVKVCHTEIHVLVSHPTPPVFDGPEDRNGLRNFDEIRFWSDYVGPHNQSRYIVDDNGSPDGLGKKAFVIMGDMNSDPLDGDSVPGAMDQLLNNPNVDSSVIPISSGAAEASTLQDDNNATHQTDAFTDTADFGEASFDGPGNLRVDYVLPSKKDLNPVCGGVFWPKQNDKSSALTGEFPFPSSDHRLVWMDLEIRDTNPALCKQK